jgi:hypothetical protein
MTPLHRIFACSKTPTSAVTRRHSYCARECQSGRMHWSRTRARKKMTPLLLRAQQGRCGLVAAG